MFILQRYYVLEGGFGVSKKQMIIQIPPKIHVLIYTLKKYSKICCWGASNMGKYEYDFF